MQDAHTVPFVEPVMPGGSSSFSVFWGLSPKSKELSHLSGCREPLAVQPVLVAGSSHTPEALASALVSTVGWAAEPVPALNVSPEARTQRAFCQASSE